MDDIAGTVTSDTSIDYYALSMQAIAGLRANENMTFSCTVCLQGAKFQVGK